MDEIEYEMYFKRLNDGLFFFPFRYHMRSIYGLSPPKLSEVHKDSLENLACDKNESSYSRATPAALPSTVVLDMDTKNLLLSLGRGFTLHIRCDKEICPPICPVEDSYQLQQM